MVGGVPVGGGAPVSIQSMLNTRTTDVDGCLAQIRALAAAGCFQILRNGREPYVKNSIAVRQRASNMYALSEKL